MKFSRFVFVLLAIAFIAQHSLGYIPYSNADDLPAPPSHLETVPAGSLVIAMDNTNQAIVAPFNLKAYGLISKMLNAGIPVKWVIKAGKAKDGVDFTASVKRIAPTTGPNQNLSFSGGPFIVHKDFAQLALAYIAGFGGSVAVYQLNADTVVDTRYDLTHRPNIAVNSVNSSIHTDLYDFAGINTYTVIDVTVPGAIGPTSCFTHFSEPHTNDTTGIAQVKAWVQSGGNFLAECLAIDTYENGGLFQTTGGINTANNSTVPTYPNPDLAFSQFIGVLTASPGGSHQDWVLNPGSVFTSNAHVHADDTGTSPPAYAATVSKLFNGAGGNVFYIGGHSYGAGGTTLSDINGQRMILNAVFVPATRPASCNLDFLPYLHTVSGQVVEDVNGDGNLSDAVPSPNVNVRLYADVNNNGVIDTGDTYLGTTTTDASGNYLLRFSTFATGNNYLIAVDSKSVPPSAGFNGPPKQGDVWAEQTYGDNPTTTAVDLGIRFGGATPTVSDNFNAADTTPANNNYRHVARFNAAAGDVSGINFGFSFNVVTNVNGGDATDNDTSNNRTVQGSLRQFIQNANAIAGANAMRFVPVVAPNAGTWWRIGVSNALPAITDANTTIDGQPYSSTDGVTVLNNNAGTLGAGGTVGVDALALATVNKPELELQNLRSTAIVPIGLDVQDKNIAIRRIAIYGFGNTANADGAANIRVRNQGDNAIIEQNIIGSGAGAFADPGSTTRSVGDNVRIVGATNVTIQNNLIGFSSGNGIALRTNGTAQILANEIRGNAVTTTTMSGVNIFTNSSATVQGNLLVANKGSGAEVASGADPMTIINNTITGNGSGASAVTAGVRLLGTATTVDRNIITASTGAGVLVGSTAAQDTITRNSIFQNGGIGIDLLGSLDNQTTGTSPFVTLNDAGDVDTGGNGLLNFPILSSATIAGSNLVVTGFAQPGAVIELFIADPDPTKFGEGRTYLATLTEGSAADADATTGTYTNPVNGLNQGTDTTNKFSFTIPLPAGVTGGSVLTATGRLANATSEFSGNVTVAAPLIISGNVFEDVNYGGGAGRTKAAASGMGRQNARVELFDNAGNFVSATTTDVNGDYSFSPATPGNYTVRVVNSSVTSSRSGYIAGLLPVQTFRTDASSGSAVPATDRVGGETPNLADAGNGATTLAALNSATTTAQSIAPVTIASGGNVSGVDFGFSFDTIVNVNNSGQGSFRQFITNANALTNAGLAQAGLVAGKDNAVFMISNGSVAAGLRATNNYFVGGVATISLASALPTVSDPIVIDATLQPGFSSAPAVQLTGTSAGAGANGVAITAGSSVIRGLTINGFAGSGISLSGAGGNTIQGNYLGTNAAGTGALANGTGIIISDTPNNIIGGTAAGNGNVISGNSGIGLSFLGAASTGNVAQGNIIGLNASASGALPNGTRGIEFATGASNNTIGGIAVGAGNIIAANLGNGVRVVTGTGNRIQRNAIYGNGGAGIDLGTDNVTPNNGLVSGGPNNGMDYPIISTAAVSGGTLTVAGYVGSAPGQPAFGNATIEIFKADNSPADQNGEVVLGDGLSLPHGEGRTYLGTITADATGNFNTSVGVAGLSVGDIITATATNASNDTSEFGLIIGVTAGGASISGFVYEDTNLNLQRDASETGTGLTLYVKLINSASPGGPALAAASVDPATGVYILSNVSAGTYTLILDDNNTLSDITPALPAGWTGVEMGTGTRKPVTVTNSAVQSQNFGLYHGPLLRGRVFNDNATGGGTANDGISNGSEAGFSGINLKLTDASGAAVYGTATTDASGAYAIAIPSTVATGTQLKLTEINASSSLSTGAMLGNTGGSYDRNTDTITFTLAANTGYTNVNFGDVAVNSLTTDGQQSGLPGTTLFYPHNFTAQTGGSVTFSTTSTQTPALAGWTQTLYRDTNANGQLDAGEPAITAPITVSAGETVAVIVKEFIPTNAPLGAKDETKLIANFNYTSASPALSATLSRDDVTTVGNPTTAGLTLTKKVDKPSALPGQTITYTVTYKNTSSDILSNVVIYDSTPAFTKFASASNGALPLDLTSVTVTNPAVGASGAMRWTFVGTLRPGGTGTITFQVTLDQ